jgi:tetratricopeptide (TPR) repeat protein
MRLTWALVLPFAAATTACVSVLPPQPTVPAAPPEPPTQNLGSAEILFDEGMALKAAGKYAEACPKLEASNRLDRTMGTLFELGDCYEHIERFASAWEAFTEAANTAKRAGKMEHAKDARDHAEQIKPKLPRLTIVVPESVAGVSGLEIKRDDAAVGQPLWNRPVPVDPGEHTIVVTAPNKYDRRESVAIKAGEGKAVSIQELDSLPMSRQRRIALGVGGVGAVGVVVGSVFGGLAISQWQGALKACHVDKAEECTLQHDGRKDADEWLSAAERSAATSTGLFIVGGVALAAAAAVWFTGPVSDEGKARTGWQFTPVVTPTGGGAVLGGRF